MPAEDEFIFWQAYEGPILFISPNYMDTVNINQLEENTIKLVDEIEKTTSAQLESARKIVGKIRMKSEDALDVSRIKVGEHPMSYIIGAAVFGFALGCLVISSRRSCTTQPRFFNRSLDQADDLASRVSGRLSRAASNLKNW